MSYAVIAVVILIACACYCPFILSGRASRAEEYAELVERTRNAIDRGGR